jgi:hypothetical protein
MKRIVLVLVVLAVLAAVPALAQSVVSDEEREAIKGVPDTWGFSIGSFWQTFDAKVKLNGTNNANGDWISLEKDLGLDNKLTDLLVQGFYRFSPRHRLDIAVVNWSREYSKTLEKDITWGDVTYEAGGTLAASNKGYLVDVTYKYSFFNNGKVDFGLNGGLSTLSMSTKLTGEGTISGGGSVAGTFAESKKVIAPIPVLGLHFEMTLAKRLFWRADGNFFAANIAGFNGNFTTYGTTVDYFVTRNLGFGAGFAGTRYRITKKDTQAGDFYFRYGFNGALAYAKLVF